ncbi:MAG: SHOCT domain-containing protein [Thermoanaerobacteraceae bacterium]|nr:SHOCT domain-containing protein [Thermoanaerobacteraceae bacterium]
MMWWLMNRWYGGWGTNGFIWGLVSLIMQVVIVVAVIYLVIYLINNSSKRQHKRNDPLEILKERYARGEISNEEFEEKKRKLME